MTLAGGCARPTVTPTQVPTSATTPLPSATATVLVTSAPTETAAPLPTVQVGCTDEALYVADVTIPDNTQIRAGEKFTKTWRLKNTGTCIWNQRYALVFVGGDRMGAVITTPLSETPPGATLEISVELTAPTADGFYTGLFELRNPVARSISIGAVTSIWVKIMVGDLVVPTAGALPVSSPVAASKTSQPCQPQSNPGYTSEVLALINAARANDNLAPLNPDVRLSAAAQAHSEDMGCHNFASHTGSDGSSIQARLAASGYIPSYSEEIIFPSGTPQDAVNWWLNDAVHRAAILNPKVKDVGVGYTFVPGTAYGGYYTVDFAAP